MAGTFSGVNIPSPILLSVSSVGRHVKLTISRVFSNPATFQTLLGALTTEAVLRFLFPGVVHHIIITAQNISILTNWNSLLLVLSLLTTTIYRKKKARVIFKNKVRQLLCKLEGLFISSVTPEVVSTIPIDTKHHPLLLTIKLYRNDNWQQSHLKRIMQAMNRLPRTLNGRPP
jgi:hypothetical protein